VPSSFYLDASALGKRYVPERGTAEMLHLFGRVTPDRFAVLTIGLLEVISIMVRRRNVGTMTPIQFTAGLNQLEIEMFNSPAVDRVEATNLLAVRSVPFIEPYSINSTDAMALCSALDLAARLRASRSDLVMVSSDQRLLRAAKAEGLTTFDPETQSTTDLDALI